MQKKSNAEEKNAGKLIKKAEMRPNGEKTWINV